ncbi:MAG TPA: ABC transporter permease [Conexibacter sp.]|nr:ABC transporter permease [Conexibacter sp.]
MLRLIVTRISTAAAAIFGASILAFIFLRVTPGDPARLIVGPLASAKTLEAQRHAMGLDQSLWTQYRDFITSFIHGDWGFSYSAGRSVAGEIGSRLPATLELGLYAFVLAFVAALVAALLVTYRRRKEADNAARLFAFTALGVPPFWAGLLLLLIFSEHLHLLPGPEGRLSLATQPPGKITGFYTIDALLHGQLATFADAVRHLILPVLAFALVPFGYLFRLLRANLLEVSREQYLLVARSKGLTEWTAFRRHALPNACLPALTASGLMLGQLIIGSVLVETVFNWPGVGEYVVTAITRQDYAVVQTFVMLSACAFVLANAAVDVLYGVIDPRVRVSAAA